MKKVISIMLIVLLLSGILFLLEAQEMKKPKSEGTALAWSLGATVIPCLPSIFIRRRGVAAPWTAFQVGVISSAISAIFVGPSAGHFYAGQSRRALGGIVIRALGVGISLALLKDTDMSDVGDMGKIGAGLSLFFAMVGYSVYDICTAPRSVRKYNESIKKTGNVYLIPKIDMKEKSYGLNVVYNF